MTENWMTPEELRGVADICDSFAPLWDVLTSGPKGGVTVESETSPELEVFDANGEVLGRITWAEEGAAFYPKVEGK